MIFVLMKRETQKFNRKLFYTLLFILGSAGCGFSQDEEIIQIEWDVSKVYTQGERSITAPVIKGQEFIGRVPNFFWNKRVPSDVDFTVSVELVSTIAANKSDLKYLESNYVDIGEFNATVALSNARNEKFVVLNVMPFVMEDGVLKRVSEMKLIYSNETPVLNYFQKSFAANSVLRTGSGTWYKIAVRTDGIYKIDKAFLDECV